MPDSSDHLTSRRRFLRDAGVAAGAAGLTVAPAAAAAPLRRPPRRWKASVAVLGGGMGGLAAAHELAERGFAVTVVEPRALGGKARSIPVPGTGRHGRSDLPGEHGFRFFPGFYKNVPDTMRRIPVRGNRDGVFDNLVDASQELLVFGDNQRFWSPPTTSTLLKDYDGPIQALETVVTGLGIGLGVPANEVEYFARKMAVFFTSCRARREGEWERVPWWDYVNAEHFSPEYRRVFGNGLTKDLVAAKGRRASTRTIG
ncbi:MAG TPA: FAD-dependent oxidoreductase, partial [Solirubrobacteraceae bacterium]